MGLHGELCRADGLGLKIESDQERRDSHRLKFPHPKTQIPDKSQAFLRLSVFGSNLSHTIGHHFMPVSEHLTRVEEKVVVLKAVKELVDSMVNFELLSVIGEDPRSQVLFKSDTHHRFFNVLLVDFLSQTDSRGPIRQTSYLLGLKSITAKPSFETEGSIEALRRATQEFTNWLDQHLEIEVWLPSIETKAILNISRTRFLKICGNISKHNFLRLISVASDLQQTLAASGNRVGLDDALLALSDFYYNFGWDIFRYHSGHIAKFLNNIRWGVYEYLQPEFRRSFTRIPGDPVGRYEFKYPSGLVEKFAKHCYWDLMNEVRDKPFMRRFEVWKLLNDHHFPL
jgi:hypothetical protein